ncbi:initiator tRNA phosphoribosyl transferase [Exophiala aquamarina CBS 119918]|uniref:Initiator tRNA phosphoribosyl transferase n=1 Tax=Exophiala aquamarina CBS 119918 TaxID=1182545 RepID=A0A072PN04_9EURO|nr:initiator tRNA phosphoribosyl transferase [Exophiala aquamarina CBS 119918]KEF61137.1 initiator tRNA phosphoribosyl transferase [Exophiala aquamarina CBS 119918]
MSSEPPTALAELRFHNIDRNPSIYATLKSIRKAALSIPNRLRSVLADAAFAKGISEQYNLPLLANERCGSWYIDPSDKVGSAYFKSTDGHHGQWDFSLRRLNLQLIPILGNSGGAVVVDSTRRGKSLPDSFSKTVPIWVAVINRALFPELTHAHCLQHPPAPDDLGLSEVSQIEGKLDGFVRSFTQLGLNIPMLRTQLKYPIRIIWEINGRSRIDFEDEEYDSEAESVTSALEGNQANRLVLCSASQRVRGAEASEGGYIQGAGDDSEGWSHGLTAQTFWKHREELMQSPEDELEPLIETLLQRDKQESRSHVPAVRASTTSHLYIGAGVSCNTDEYSLIVNCQNDGQHPTVDPRVLDLKCRAMKLGSKDLRDQLPLSSKVISEQLRKDADSRVLVTCSSGKDLSVGVAVAVLCLHYDDQGKLREPGVSPTMDKSLVKQRLAWITHSKPDANPSRATLQAVNSFLMHRPD